MQVLPFPHFDSPNITQLAFPGRFPQTDQPVISPKVPRGMIPVGTTRDGRIYYLDASQSFRLLVIGPTKRGKTWVIRGLADWLNLLNWLLLFVNDTANEIITSSEPNYKYQHDFPPFSRPLANTRLRKWVAEWVAQEEEQNIFSLRIADLDAIELQYLLGITDNSPKQILVLEEIVEYFSRQREKNPDYKVTFNELESIRKDPSLLFEGYTGTHLDKETIGEPLANIYFRLYSLLKKRVIETNNRLNPIGLITGEDGRRNRHVILDWSSEKIKKIRDPTSLTGTYISVFLDRIYEARKQYRTSKIKASEKFVPPYFIIWDEAQPFIIENSYNFPSVSMKSMFTQGRKEGVGTILGFQSVGQTDEIYLENTEYAFIFALAGEKELSKIQKAFPNIYPDNYQGRANLAALSDIRWHEFLAIDRMNQTWQFVTAFPPLSKHLEEDTTK